MSNSDSKFQKLTPIKNKDLTIYDDALNFVFSNDEIKNVAISGAYCAGKSSMLESYKEAHPNIRFIHISLAYFEPGVQSNNSGEFSTVVDTSKYSEPVLEGKILNQLIHQIDPENIPQTHFKIKHKLSNDKIIKDTIKIMIFLISIAYIFDFNNWRQYILTLSITSITWLRDLLALITNSVLIFGSGLIIHSILKTQNYKNIFKKMTFQGNEIEIFSENNDESYFDKYLNEVLYLFENSAADVIVFEDMDRYNANQIFEKLREINTLVNNKFSIKEKQKIIRFFYLLRDDIFTSKDRTKFFDFIIPIVPVIDSSNSYDKFIDLFKEGGIINKFKEEFLQGLSLYIDDMRILKNIYNEFIIYYDRLKSTELDSNKLLAIIAYKNIFPRDFSDLQLGRGFVHTLFEKKHDFVKDELIRIDSRIVKIEEKIALTNKEILNSVDELNAAFLKMNRHISDVAGKSESAFGTHTQLIKAIKENLNSVYSISSPYGSRSKIDLSTEFKQLLQNPDYVKRKEAIERKSGNQIEKLKAEIQRLQWQKSVIQYSRLQDVITNENIISVTFKNEIGTENDFKEIKADPYFPLIKYLVRNGYIDETYPDYMTYFYENSLSRIDKIFLRSVMDEKPKEYYYSLKDPQKVLTRLRPIDFEHEEILNFDLLSYLLETKQDNEISLKRFINQLIDNKNYKFIGEFLAIQKNTELFIESINHLWPAIFEGIISESDFSDAQKKQYAIDTLYFSSDADIEALNKDRHLTTFINNFPTFLDINNPNVKKIIADFKLLDVKFASIDYYTVNKELFDAVYRNNHYQLTFEMISLMLEKKYNLTKSDDFKHKNYSLISSKQDEPLVSYVNYNINDYIGIVLENCDELISDDESVALEIINNDEVSTENKEKYICFLQTEIGYIKDVTDKELWSSLLQLKRVKYSEKNILDYFFLSEKGLDSFLVEFINSNGEDLKFDYELINRNYGNNTALNFYQAIVTCNQLSNEKYETILLSLNRCYKSFSFKEVDNEKIMILVKIGVIAMTSENLTFMRENYPEQLMGFIKKNINKYTNEVINEGNFDFDEMLSVLDENVSDKYKINLLEHTSDEISIQGKKYSTAVKKHILEYNLDEADIPFLLNIFPQESQDVKEVIKQISINYISDIIGYKYFVPFELYKELLVSEGLKAEQRMELFALCLPHMDLQQTKESLRILNLSDFLSLFNRKRRKFEINPINKQILAIFKEKNWCSFDIDKDAPSYYRANGRKVE